MATSDGSSLVTSTEETQPKHDIETGRTTRQKRKYPKLKKPTLKRIKRYFYKRKKKRAGAESNSQVEYDNSGTDLAGQSIIKASSTSTCNGEESDSQLEHNGRTDQNTVQSTNVDDSDSELEHGEDSGQSIASVGHGTCSGKSLAEGYPCDTVESEQGQEYMPVHNASNGCQDSDVNLSIKVPLSLPVQLQLPLISKPDDEPHVYKLHISEVFQDKKFTRYAVGTPPLRLDPFSLTSERVLMMVGATGTGKTTLINGIANYIYGTQWANKFRLKVIDNEGQRSQAHGQTKYITACTFPVKEDSPLSYTLTVIDTPGFGDSDGLLHDQYIVEQINEFFSLPPPVGITTLHGIGFVVKASDGRLTPMQQYIFNSILSIFGRDVEDNIFVMITFCDAEKPLVLNALRAAAIPFRGNGFKFNNSALFADNGACNDGDTEDDDDFDFNSNFWKMGMKSFKNFFKNFEMAEAKSLQQTKEVLEERKQLEILIQGLRQQIVSGMGKLNELQQEEKVLSQHKEDVEANKNFNYKVTITEQVKIETSKRVTNCVACSFTCHKNCVYNKDKNNCRVMKKEHCTVCPGKCHYHLHINNPFYYETVLKTVTRMYDHLKERYEDATSKLSQSEAVLCGLRRELEQVQMDVMATVRKAHGTLQRLEEIALNPDPLSETDYIRLCIETEKREAKPNWTKRIQYFEEMLLQGKCISSVKELPLINASDALSEGDRHLGIDQLPHDCVRPTDQQRQESHDGNAQDLISLLNYSTN